MFNKLLHSFRNQPLSTATASDSGEESAAPAAPAPPAAPAAADDMKTGTASVRDPDVARRSGQRFQWMQKFGKKGRSSHDKTWEREAHASDVAGAPAAKPENSGKRGAGRMNNLLGRRKSRPVEQVRPAISAPKDGRSITKTESHEIWKSYQRDRTYRSGKHLMINGRPVTTGDISGPRWISSPGTTPDMNSPEAENDWIRLQHLVTQLDPAHAEHQVGQPVKPLQERLTELVRKVAGWHKTDPSIEAAKAEFFEVARRIATRYDESRIRKTDEWKADLWKQFDRLDAPNSMLMKAALERYAPPATRIAFEEFLNGKAMPLEHHLVAAFNAVDKMLDQLEFDRYYQGVASRDAHYWLIDGLLVRSDREGNLSFPLATHSVEAITMSPDQRVHALCREKDNKRLITLGTNGMPDEFAPLSLPPSTYQFAVANNHTVAVAAHDETGEPVLMVLNGFERKQQGRTDFTPMAVAAPGIAAGEQQMEPSHVKRKIESLVFMPEGHLAVLFDDKKHWRFEQQQEADNGAPVRYRGIPAEPLPRDKRRHQGRKLVKRGRPAACAPRPAPVPERLVITPGGALGGFDKYGTPLIYTLQREWQRAPHDKNTPLDGYFNHFARDVITAGGLSFLGWPDSSDYLKTLQDRKKGMVYSFRKAILPFTVRVNDESLSERIKDHWRSHHAYLFIPSFLQYRKALKQAHNGFYGAMKDRLMSERELLTMFATHSLSLNPDHHDKELSDTAVNAMSNVLELITKHLPEAPAPARTPAPANHTTQKRNKLKKPNVSSAGTLAARNQKMRYENYHKSKGRVRSPDNVLHVVNGALTPLLGTEHPVVQQIQRLLADNVFIGFVSGEARGGIPQALNLKQDHYNEFSIASSLLVSYASALLTAALKAEESTTRKEDEIDGMSPEVARNRSLVLSKLDHNIAGVDFGTFKQTALQLIRGEKNALCDDHVDALASLKKHNILDIDALTAFSNAYGHYSTAMKQPHHKVRRAMRGQGVLGTQDIAHAFETLLALLPVGSSITISTRRGGGLDLEGMSLFLNLLQKHLVHAASGATVQKFGIEPVIILSMGHEYAVSFTKTENGFNATAGEAMDLTYTALALKAQFGIGVSKLDPVEKNDVVWAYVGCNAKYKDTLTWLYRHSVTVDFFDEKASSGLQAAVQCLAGEIHPADMLARANHASATVDRGLNRVISLDIEPLVAAGVVWDLITDSFKAQGKALVAAVSQLNLLYKTEEGMAFTADIDNETYVFKMMKRVDATKTDIYVTEFQGVKVGDGIGLDGQRISNGNEYFQQKVQPGIAVRTRHIAGTPVTSGGVTMQFNDNKLSGMATSYTYQANFADQKYQDLKEAAHRRTAASLEEYIPVLKDLLKHTRGSERERLQTLFKELARLPRDTTVTVHVQYRPSVIADAQRQLPIQPNIFSSRNDGTIAVQSLSKAAETHPDFVKVSQIVINEQRIYSTGSSDGITVLRTQSNAKLKLATSSSISFTYPSPESSEPDAISYNGMYFTEKRMPAKGLLPKLGPVLGNIQLAHDRAVLKFLTDPYRDQPRNIALDFVRTIRNTMRHLRQADIRNASELVADLSEAQRNALLILFPKKEDPEQLDEILISKIVGTPEYYEHFQETNHRLLERADIPATPGSEDRDSSEAGRPVVPAITVTAADTPQFSGLSAIVAPSVAVAPVVQDTTSTGGSRSSRSSRSGQTASAESHSATGRDNPPARAGVSGSSDHLAAPVPPAGVEHSLRARRAALGADSGSHERFARPGRLSTVVEERAIVMLQVASSTVMGWPEDANKQYLTREEIAADLRNFLNTQNPDQDLGPEHQRLTRMASDQNTDDMHLLSQAGVEIDRLIFEEDVERSGSSGSSSPELLPSEGRWIDLKTQLLGRLQRITEESPLSDAGLYHFVAGALAASAGRADGVNPETIREDALSLRQSVVTQLMKDPADIVNRLAFRRGRDFGLENLIEAIADPNSIPLQDRRDPSHRDTMNLSGALLQLLATATNLDIALYVDGLKIDDIKPISDSRDEPGEDHAGGRKKINVWTTQLNNDTVTYSITVAGNETSRRMLAGSPSRARRIEAAATARLPAVEENV